MIFPHHSRHLSSALGLAAAAATMLVAAAAPAAAAPATGEVRFANSADAVPGSYIVVFRDARWRRAPSPTGRRAWRPPTAAPWPGSTRRRCAASRYGCPRLPPGAWPPTRRRVRRAGPADAHRGHPDEPAVLGPGPDRPARAGRWKSYTPNTAAPCTRTSWTPASGSATPSSAAGPIRLRLRRRRRRRVTATGTARTWPARSAAPTTGWRRRCSWSRVRVLDCDGSGTLSGVIAGVDWVTANAIKPAVANMSLGGGRSARSRRPSAVDRLRRHLRGGGRQRQHRTRAARSPAALPAAITVAASTARTAARTSPTTAASWTCSRRA